MVSESPVDEVVIERTDPPEGPDPLSAELQTLLKEYERKDKQSQDTFNQIVRTAGLGATLFIGLISYFSASKSDVSEIVFWLLPISFSVLFALIFQLAFFTIFNGLYPRQLEDEISRITGIPFFHYNYSLTRAH